MKTLLKNSKRNLVTKRAVVPAPLNKKRWKRRLAFTEPGERGASVYVRPYRCDEAIIRELSDFTGETYNTVAAKLIHVALSNKPLTTEVFERHVQSLDHIEDYFENAVILHQMVSSQLAAIEKQQTRTHRFLLATLSEIYCLLHIGVSLIRALFTAIVGSRPDVEPTIEKMIANFRDVDDRVIKKSFSDYNSILQFYKLTGEKINPYQLFLRANLGDNNWIKRRAEWYERERDAKCGTNEKSLNCSANKAPDEAPSAQRDQELVVGTMYDDDRLKAPSQGAHQFNVAESDEAGDDDDGFDQGDGYDGNVESYEDDDTYEDEFDDDEFGDEFFDEDQDDDDSENDEG